MAGGTLDHYARVALDVDVSDVVVDVSAREFRVGRDVAGFTLQSAMTARKTEQ